MRKKKEPKPKKVKPVKIDGGIIPEEIDRIRKALRQVWCWTSVARRNCIKRVTDANQFVHCENEECPSKGQIVPKVFVDHIEVLGDPRDPTFIQRLYCKSDFLQALCKKCHDKKTRQERADAKLLLSPGAF